MGCSFNLKMDKNCISWLDLDFWVVKILDLKSKFNKIRLLTLKWKNRCIKPTSLKEAYTQNGRNLMGVEKMSKKSWSDFSAKVTWILPVSALFSNDSTFFSFSVCVTVIIYWKCRGRSDQWLTVESEISRFDIRTLLTTKIRFFSSLLINVE